MFDDFQKTKGHDARRRFGGSIAVAVLIYGGGASVVVAATAGARHAAEEKLTQVEFAPPPEPQKPEPEPPPVVEPTPEQKKARPKVKRQELAPPDEVPDEKPKESDAPLAEAEAPGPLDGFTDGVVGGVGTAPAAPPPPPPPPPPSAPAPVKKPAELSGNRMPPYPKAAARQELEGTVVVEFMVLPDGTATAPKIVSGPSIFHEAVLAAVPSWRFEPATQGGKKIPFRMTKKVIFRLEDA
jgi:protein TonB